MYYSYKFIFCASNTGSIKQTTTQPKNSLTMNTKMNLRMNIMHIKGGIEYFGNTMDK